MATYFNSYFMGNCLQRLFIVGLILLHFFLSGMSLDQSVLDHYQSDCKRAVQWEASLQIDLLAGMRLFSFSSMRLNEDAIQEMGQLDVPFQECLWANERQIVDFYERQFHARVKLVLALLKPSIDERIAHRLDDYSGPSRSLIELSYALANQDHYRSVTYIFFVYQALELQRRTLGILMPMKSKEKVS